MLWKNFRNLSKAISQAKNVSQVSHAGISSTSPLYSKTKISEYL